MFCYSPIEIQLARMMSRDCDPAREASDCRPEAILAGLARLEAPDRCFSQRFYTDEQIFVAEKSVLARQWVFAFHQSEIPNPGWKEVKALGESLIVIRQGEAFRAFYNVCRHRGSPIIETEQTGTANRLICPYHAWAYGLDGKLLHTPSFTAACDDPMGLVPAGCMSVAGMVFVSLSDVGAETSFVEDEVGILWQFHGLERAQIACRRQFQINANWKLAVENFLECYHCLPNHPQLCTVYDHIKMTAELDNSKRTEYLKFSAEWTSRARRVGAPTRPPRRLNPDVDQFAVAFRMGIKPGFDTLSESGKPVAPLMGEFSEYDGGETFGFVGPFLHFSLANDHVVLIRIVPSSALFTTIDVSWLVDPIALEHKDYDERRLRWLWESTVEQDCKMIERAQRGVTSKAFVPGPYTPLESDSRNFKSWYLRVASQSMSTAGDA